MASVKTWNGLTIANMKTFNMLESANVKTIDGVGLANLKISLIQCLELDETSGTTLYDAHTSAKNHTITGSPSLNQTGHGNLGACIAYTNIHPNQYASTTPFVGTFPCSMSMWIKLPNSTTVVYMYTHGRQTNYAGYQLTVKTTNLGTFTGTGGGPGSSSRRNYDYAVSLSTNTWYHVVATWQNVTTVKVYLNGVEQTNPTMSGSGNSLGLSGGIHGFDLGALAATTYINQVAIWQKVLTANEVKVLNNSGNGLAYASW